MSGNISNSNTYFFVFPLAAIDVIVVVTAGFIAIDTFTGDIQSVHFWTFMRKKALLNLTGKGERMLYAVLFLAQCFDAIGQGQLEKNDLDSRTNL